MRGDALADVIEESERVLATLRTLMDISEAEHGTMLLHPEEHRTGAFRGHRRRPLRVCR